MTSRGGSSITYTSYNLPSLINSGANSSAISYGAFRNRYKQVANTGGTLETMIYVAGLLEKVTERGHRVSTSDPVFAAGWGDLFGHVRAPINQGLVLQA